MPNGLFYSNWTNAINYIAKPTVIGGVLVSITKQQIRPWQGFLVYGYEGILGVLFVVPYMVSGQFNYYGYLAFC